MSAVRQESLVYDLVSSVDEWNRAGVPAVVARPMALRGFGSRREGEALALSAAGVAGTLLNGTMHTQLVEAAEELLASGERTARLVETRISYEDGVAAGYLEGGSADVLLQPASAIEAWAWDAFRAQSPIALVAVVGAADMLGLDREGNVYGTMPSEAIERIAREEAQALLDAAVPAHRVAAVGETQLLVECFVPLTRLLVVGAGIVAEAIAAQADLLHWEPTILGDDLAAVEAQLDLMGAGDLLVLLTHNREIDAPILAKALRGGVGYVGGLGSRRNQEGRRRRLQALELTDDEIARYRGPLGLDIGAANPAEVAVAVCAEAIAVLRQRGARPLSETAGPINA
jgi:xanthine dehydrogenase accessory factor